MKNHIQDRMAEATRLTRAGRLSEATEIIQRTLAGLPSNNVSTSKTTSDDPVIDAEFSVLEDSSARTNGQFVDKVYKNRVGTRPYKLYIPSSYTGQSVPLVVMLHGCTQTSVDFAAGTRMNMLAEGKTFLVAYPQQGTSANNSKCWNWFQPTDQQRNAGEPSLIAGITHQIMREYSVNVRQIYVAGLSSGGAMATIMAATYPDLYTAIGVHSGLPYGAANDLPSAFAAMKQGAPHYTRSLPEFIPLIMFHGDRDTTVAPVNADHLLDQWLNTANKEPKRVQEVRVLQGQAASGRNYTRSNYYDVNSRTIIEKWTIQQAGHAWSGGSPQGSFTDPKGPDASIEMIRFFMQHNRKV